MKNVVMLQHLDHFAIGQILESGQVFRFERVSESSYLLIAKQRLIKIMQQPHSSSVLIHNTTISEVDDLWSQYFDLDTNYHNIATVLSHKDEHMKKAVAFGQGIRLLRQDPWEMLISFIISQNKAIPHIKACIKNLTQQFGFPINEADGEGNYYFTFPTPKELGRATEEELRACKVGFRAPYIMDACQKVLNGEILLNDLYFLSIEEARKKLMMIKGVGPKVADCILLFAYSKMELFPTDVWIKRVIEGLYFGGKTIPIKEIQKFAEDYFGDLRGYAQQYLFYYARENALFKPVK
ncbi:8-oxoguanine DNA glycosylase [Sporanaerobium hydrogeniformans]|uniref:8-oxoguanine DNA glycosylase n=1 Tax=Sporanaerobium hydrogeniformans TaxID=3072179 RepID=A0AC61DAB6_9FIRM|nr:DNA glycosylase [Sporanaerobium hydrogeniformans]PHV69957.1 8-oxoguanine DNA glycosylase [Sporanaerobium hydrogeniformans]